MNAHALKPEGGKIASDLAQRHGLSIDAVTQMLGAVFKGNGRMAQFDHPEFGRLGQWLRGGLLMQGEMVNQELKRRVDALCNEISEIFENQPGRLRGAVFKRRTREGMHARCLPRAHEKDNRPSSGPIRHRIGGRTILAIPTPLVPRTLFSMLILAGRDDSLCG